MDGGGQMCASGFCREIEDLSRRGIGGLYKL
jgi:hypothetical protein